MTVRERIEEDEIRLLAPNATKASGSAGREREEAPDDLRTCFMRDRDRILHCKGFRRLMHKTQAFFSPEGDHYRTRLTHTLEVTQIARTIARGLRLNEDLTESVALGHDLGHTPFGHTGERALTAALGRPFRHNEQSVRVVRFLEKDGKGLNLTREVVDGILCHTGSRLAFTPEGQIIRFADRIAYINHDIDDAIRAGVLSENDIPFDVKLGLGGSKSRRIASLVSSMIRYGQRTGEIGLEEKEARLMDALRDFMFQSVYQNPLVKGEEGKIEGMILSLYRHFIQDTQRLPREYWSIADRDGIEAAVCDYIAGMTDRYAVSLYQELSIPKGWSKY